MNKQIRAWLPVLTTCLLMVVTGCSAKAKLDRRLKSADKYFAAGDYARAEVEYMNVIQMSSLNSHAMSRLGTIYYEQKRYRLAYDCLSKASQQASNDLDLHVKLGNLNLAGGNISQAREEANFVLNRMPGNTEALVLLAESITNQQDAEGVRQRLEKLSAQMGDTVPVQMAFGTLYFRLKDVKAAEAAFRRAQALDQKSSAAHYAIGNILWAQKDFASADSELKTAAGLAPARSLPRLQYAVFKIATGKTNEGKLLLEQMTKETPDYPPAWIRLAEFAYVEKKPSDCEFYLKQALARDPSSYEALLLRSRLMLERGEVAQVVGEYDRISSIYPTPQVYLLLAKAQLLDNDPKAALKSIDQALAKGRAAANKAGGDPYQDTVFVEALLLQAEINLSRNEFDQTIGALTELRDKQPKLPQVYVGLGTAYRGKGNLDKALEIYEQFEAHFSTNAEAPYLKGLVYEQQNKKQYARTAFARALELAPNYLPATVHLVGLDISERQTAAALERVQKDIEKNPASAELQVLLANVYQAQFDLEHTEGALDRVEGPLLKAIELNPTVPGPYVLLAKYYQRTGKNVKAVEKLKEGLVKAPRDASALLLLALIQSEMKDFSDSRKSYEKLLEIDPNSGLGLIGLNNLAYLYSVYAVEPKDLDKALEMGRKARELLSYQVQPGQDNAREIAQRDGMDNLRASATDTLGWTYYKKKEYSRALDFLQQSVVTLRSEPEVLYHLGMAYYMTGQESEARNALESAQKSTNDFPGKAEIARRLEILAINSQAADPRMRASLEKQLDATPDDPVVLSRLSNVYEHEKAPDKTVSAYEAAYKKDPKNVLILVKLAGLYSGSKDPSKRALALVRAKEAYALAPDNPNASCILGRLVFAEKDYKRAVGLLEQSAAKLPKDEELLYDLAMAYYSVGRISESVTTVSNVLRLNGGFSKAAEANRFLQLAPLGAPVGISPEKALAAENKAQDALKSDPEDVPARMVVALCFKEHGKSKEANDAFEKVLDKYPDFSPATKPLTRIYLEREDYQNAYKMATRARQAYPDDSEVAINLGIALYCHEDYRNAERLLVNVQKETADGMALYYKGKVNLRLSQNEVAKESFQQALKLSIQPKLAEDARRELAKLEVLAVKK